MSYSHLFSKLWEDYTARTPLVSRIHQFFLAQGEEVINDHIAFRTFNDSRVNISQLAKFFINYGYQEKGQYEFPVKKLVAKHYEHPDGDAPKVFISELLTEHFSPFLQATIKSCIDKIALEDTLSESFLTRGTVWQPLSNKTYQELLVESEYAAWMYAFGFCANHFTVSVNRLKTMQTLAEVNQFLQARGIPLNSSGGLIKGTQKECLEQSSTLAGMIDVSFEEGTYSIPSCYYEFAKRYPSCGWEIIFRFHCSICR